MSSAHPASRSLGGKSVLVTGGANGIGAASARLFAAYGAKVAVADIDQEAGQQVAADIEKAGGEALFVRADVSSADDVDAMVAAVVDRFGRLDCAMNNAGLEEAAVPLHEATEAVWDQLHGVNLKGVWLCMRAEIRQMLAQQHGTIVNTASVAGLVGLPLGIATYSATKHGVVGLTRTAAVEYAKQNIRVNAVCPGAVRTAMLDTAIAAGMFTEAEAAALHPTGVLLMPGDVGEAAAWLLSEASSCLTGQAIAVDGGLTAG